MSFEVLEETTNRVIGRKEAKLVVHHPGAGTPDRITVKRLASDHYKTPTDRVFVKSITTRTGGSSALCAVEVYDDEGTAQRMVPAYLKNRNLPKDQRVSRQKKGEEEKPAATPVSVKKTAAEPKAEAKAEPRPSAKVEPTKDTKAIGEKTSKPAEKETKPTGRSETKPKQ